MVKDWILDELMAVCNAALKTLADAWKSEPKSPQGVYLTRQASDFYFANKNLHSSFVAATKQEVPLWSRIEKGLAMCKEKHEIEE